MALIKCPECGHKVSDKAEMCPECGCPIGNGAPTKESTIHKGRNVLESDPSWLKELKKNKESKAKKLFWISIIFAIIGFCFLIPFIANNGTLTGINMLFLPLFIIAFIIGFLLFAASSIIAYKILFYVDEFNGFIIAFDKRGTQEIYVDGKTVIYEPHYHSETHGDEEGIDTVRVLDRATLLLPDKTRLTLLISWKECLFKYEPQGTYKDTTTEVYVINSVKKKNNTTKSDMEKKLIRNAKIDALANIDPTNTEKSKENLKIYKELDDLDD